MYNKYCVNIFKTLKRFLLYTFFLPTLNGKVFFPRFHDLLLNPNSNFSSVLKRMLFLSMERLNRPISMPEFFPVSSIVYTSYSLHCDAT